MRNLTILFKAVFMSLTLIAASAAMAQVPSAYPARPVQFIVPFAAGTTADIIARLLGEYLSKDLGQPIVVDNRPGAGGTLGANAAARAPNDGHTLVLGTVASHAIATIAFPNVAYDPARDFEPIMLIANVPNLLVVNRSLPVSNAAEFIAYAKKTGGLNFTSAGTGTTSQLAGELIRMQLGAPLTHVPYKSGAQALTDVVSGVIPVMIWQVSPLKPHIASGAIKPIAALSASRIASFPDVPTLAETLLPGFDSSAWFGVLAPRGTPRAILNRLHQTIKRSLDVPDVRDRFEKLGLERADAGPEEFRQIIVNDLKRWQPVVQATKPESK